MIKPAAAFEREIAKAELSKAELARTSGVSLATIHALINPSQQPHRRGGVREVNAWKIARAVAGRTGENEDAVFERLFERVDYTAVDGRRINQRPDLVAG